MLTALFGVDELHWRTLHIGCLFERHFGTLVHQLRHAVANFAVETR